MRTDLPHSGLFVRIIYADALYMRTHYICDLGALRPHYICAPTFAFGVNAQRPVSIIRKEKSLRQDPKCGRDPAFGGPQMRATPAFGGPPHLGGSNAQAALQHYKMSAGEAPNAGGPPSRLGWKPLQTLQTLWKLTASCMRVEWGCACG
jgi:hypothetical protein